MAIDDLKNKIENGGINARGKLGAAEWNELVEAVIANRGNIAGLNTALTTANTNIQTLQSALITLNSRVDAIDLTPITARIQALEQLAGGKYGYAEYRDGTIYFYDEQGGVVLTTLSLSGNIYTIDIGYTGSSVFSVLTGDTHKYLTIEPTTTLQTSIGGQSTPVTEAYDYVVAINTGSGYVNRISGNNITSATSFDIRPWIVVGTNMIRISVTGRTSNTTKTLTLTCTLTSLSLSCLHNWRTPWNEGEAYTVQSIYFAGAIQKTLHVGVDGTEIPELAETFSPSENASTIAKSITIPASNFPVGANDPSGSHTVEIWMTGQGVETSHISFNILCVKAGETLPLICINNAADTAVNFSGNNLFEYYVLGADQVDVDVLVTAGGQSYALPRQTNTNLVDGELNTFATQLEVNTEETEGTVTVTVYPSAGGEVNTDGIVILSMALDNSKAFLATSNPAFYFTAGTRSNGENDRDCIKNMAVDPVESYQGVFTDMSWNTDGWTTDPEGFKALVLPAGTTASFPTLLPFSFADNTNGLTIEFMFKASVIADLTTPIIAFTDTATGTNGEPVTVGVVVYPTKIRVLGSREQENLEQEVGLCENTVTHITITLQKAYAGSSKNLVTLYVNGYPNVSFDYNVNSTFGNGSLVMGQQSTDIYLYMMRLYSRALEGTSVIANFLNAIFNGVVDRDDVREKNNIITDTIQYALCKDKYNCFIVEPDDETKEIPSFYNDDKVTSTIYFEYAQHHDWDVKITKVPIDGQGTTSKKYFRWNLRGKLASGCEWFYTNGQGTQRGQYSNTATFVGKKGYMDGGAGGGVHLKIERFTAKKNIASQQQGHKIGATGMYDDLYAQIGLKSELPNSNYRVAVWQYPFLGFRKRGDSYEFIGLYTAGPDKGCKVTFGYDADQYPMAMCIEGPNHAPRGTRFLHPWVNVTYEATQETLCFGGQEGWDDDFSAGYDSDDTSAAANILAMYVSEWKPAYDLVYHCSPYIAKLTNDKNTPMQVLYQYTSSRYDSDPATFREAIEKMMELCPAKEYALVLWGHGTGWAVTNDSVASEPSRRAYGYDSSNGKWMNITQMVTALDGLPKMKFIFADCCNMACAEVAYALRNRTEYLIGSPAEIPGFGAPYHLLMKELFNTSDTFYKNIVDTYYDYYANDYVLNITERMKWPYMIDTHYSVPLAAINTAYISWFSICQQLHRLWIQSLLTVQYRLRNALVVFLFFTHNAFIVFQVVMLSKNPMIKIIKSFELNNKNATNSNFQTYLLIKLVPLLLLAITHPIFKFTLQSYNKPRPFCDRGLAVFQ